MIEYVVIFIRIIIVAIGILLSWKTLSISRKSKKNNSAYWFLSLGFLIFTLTQILEGILFELTTMKIEWVHIIESILSSFSFILIILAITRFKESVEYK